MASVSSQRRLRIGVDVGGTNTDGVIIDPTRSMEVNRGIIAWHKSPTTANPSHGIAQSITTMFNSASVDPSTIASVTIGTTHFVNAVVTRDATRLSKVAVLRLSGPFGKHAPPCIDWPSPLRKLVLGHYGAVKGGLEVDGSLIDDIKEEEIVEQCELIKKKGIRSVVVIGIFSPIDTIERQEERAAEIVRRELGDVDVVMSKTVANLGFLERENAAILNASILSFARKTIASFQTPIKQLGLDCPVFITQNDGTILSGEAAAQLPIRTFSSGPTNSMRGAAFLVGREESQTEAVMVVDIGGTTTDVGLLLANGFPRQQAAYSELSGVRMNFSYPDVKSIGLGGGSLVRNVGGILQVGPESVGYELPEKALVFGGNVATATDYTVAMSELDIGNPKLVHGKLREGDMNAFKAETKLMLERIIDTMKTSPEDLPVLLVGGGAIIAPNELKGASRVIRPEWSGVANAIGAAMARVSAVVDTVRFIEKRTTRDILAEIEEEAKKKTVEAGALVGSVKVVEVETLPLQYIANKTRFIVRAAGAFDFSRSADFAKLGISADTTESVPDTTTAESGAISPSTSSAEVEEDPGIDVNFDLYKPRVVNREWFISEIDLQWISIGCYILGTGGGGSPYSTMLRVREILRAGGVIRVVSPEDLKDDDRVGCGCGVGSPTVGIEKLSGDEMMQAQEHLYKLYSGSPATHIIPVEVGGSNGLQGFVLGASINMNVPCVDGDWMGRAYPTKWQTTPVVFREREIVFAPVSIADGNGNVLYMPTATSDHKVEQVIRAALSQMGSAVGSADGPVTGVETRRWAVKHTLSLSWRIGREVARARKESRTDHVAEAIIDAVGGPETARVLFKGKIVGVERKLRMGHIYGEVIIEGPTNSVFAGKIKIPFKNENIAVVKLHQGQESKTGEEKDEDTLAIVPDLISVIDAQNGEAIGTPEYRYGLLVLVIGITASSRWTSPRGIELGGPKSFGLDHLQYQPLGKFAEPRSVIDEYDVKS